MENPITEAAGWFGREAAHLRHHETSAAHAAAAVTIGTSNPGGPVSNVFTEIKARAHAIAEDLEHLDENAIGAVEAIKVNPNGVSIVNSVASIAHLPDPQGLLAGADAFLKTIAAAIAAAAAATAPSAPLEPSAFPAGPSVAGQA